MLSGRLTPREIEILDLIKSGCGDKQVAFKLGICTESVKSHLQLIFARLEAANRTEAVVKALEAGYLQLNNPETQERGVKMRRELQAVYKPVAASPGFKERLLKRLLKVIKGR